MVNRRLIRIKVFKVVYAKVASGTMSIDEALKTLDASCTGTLNLYYFILNAAVALQKAAQQKIDTGLKKYMPTPEERNPNRKFAENSVSAHLAAAPLFTGYCESHGLLWTDELGTFIKKLYATICTREYFQEYMASEERSVAQDCELFVRIFADEFYENEDLESFLEDMSVYWMDDLAYAINVVIKSLDTFKAEGRFPVQDVYLKADDKEYAEELLKAVMLGYGKYSDMVCKAISNWEDERLVLADRLLTIQGIAEAVRFPNIPLKVTINEYVEISKFYSTANSRQFINGLLDRILKRLVDEGEIVKTGRGLIDN